MSSPVITTGIGDDLWPVYCPSISPGHLGPLSLAIPPYAGAMSMLFLTFCKFICFCRQYFITYNFAVIAAHACPISTRSCFEHSFFLL